MGIFEDEEPEESEAVVVEEVYEIPDFDIPNAEDNYANQFANQNKFNMQSEFDMQNAPNTNFYDPVYRSARQYYYVSPNGSPLPAPPPPPFPQYSNEPNYGYYGFSPPQKFGLGSRMEPSYDKNFIINDDASGKISNNLSEEEEMELYGIENNCIRVVNDYMNGGYKCDDFD